MSRKCTQKGNFRHVDGGMVCAERKLLRLGRGNANPGQWLNKWERTLDKVLSWRKRSELNHVDKRELQNFNRTSPESFSNDGLELLNENKARLKCVELMVDLKAKIPRTTLTCDNESVPNAPKFIVDAAKLFKENPQHDKTLLGGACASRHCLNERKEV